MLFCEAQIKGACRGYKNRDTFFELTNGRIFQQDEYKYQYNYQYRPNVKVFQEGSVFYLEVQGMNSRVKVKKVK
ncbi:hypothetical protein [Halalkalibacter oceani]|uniref:hypothetical protein n=1 Tax=Halalkalibacter oceani TaxID=1653776 RepID=UPI0033956FDB